MNRKSKGLPLHCKSGFTLVELLVVISIMAILASVAIPAYQNYINRSKQSDAAASLMTARLEMEEFYSDNGWYTGTIKCLPSFAGASTACLTACGAGCANTSKPRYYTIYLTSGPNKTYYQIAATRKIYSYAPTDSLTISSTTETPIVVNTSALKFSVFQWLFQ